MRLPRWLFWLLLYALGTFGWMVFFEHGPGWDRFQAGAKADLTRALEKLHGWGTGKIKGASDAGGTEKQGASK